MTTLAPPRPATTTGPKASTNAAAARSASLGDNAGCPFCQREGLPILPVRYAVIPKWIKARKEPVLAAHKQLDPKGPKSLAHHRYALRTLRQGFVHVYFGTPGAWQVYATTADGLLRLLPDPDDPDAKTDKQMSEQCRRDGHNIPAGFIRIPDRYSRQKNWIAFSQDIWSKHTRQAYEADPKSRLQPLDCAALSLNPDAVADAFALTATPRTLGELVEEYSADASDAAARRSYPTQSRVQAVLGKQQGSSNGSMPSVHGFHPRTGEAEALGRFAKQFEEKAIQRKKPAKVAVFALHDPVGIAQELNHSRLLMVQWRTEYVNHISISRPKIISQAILGLKAIYEQNALLSVAAENGVTVVEDEQAARSSANRGKTVVTVDKLPEFSKKHMVDIPGFGDPTTGMITPGYSVPLSELAEGRARSDWGRLSERYREKDRAEFEKRDAKQLNDFQTELEGLGGDYSDWLRQSDWMKCFHDYDSRLKEEAARLTMMAAPVLSGGPTDTKTYALWEHWLGKLTAYDANNPAYAAYFGGRKTVLEYLVPKQIPKDFMQVANGFAGDTRNPDDPVPAVEKGDKLYDTVKALITSEAGERALHAAGAKARLLIDQWPAFKAALAHIQAAHAAAISLLGNKLKAGSHAVAQRAHQAALQLYNGIEVVLVKMTMTIGQYFSALKAAGFDAAKAVHQTLQAGVATAKVAGRKVRSLALAGLLNLSDPRISAMVIDVTLWVADRGKELAEHLKSLGSDVLAVAHAGAALAAGAGKAVAGRLRVAGITVSQQAAKAVAAAMAKLRVMPEKTGQLARKLFGSMARIGGSKEVLLAGFALCFQGWAFLDASNQLKDKIGPEKAEAYLSIVSASIGMTAATVEIFGSAVKAIGLVKLGGTLLLGAGLVACCASFVDGVASLMAAFRVGSKGDKDAAMFYTGAGVAFLGSAFFGAWATLAGTAALLGPFGIALLLVVIGTGLLFAALCAEDTAAEIWLSRCYWGDGRRREDGVSAKWTDAQHDVELAEMNSLILGAKAEIGFNDELWQELTTGIDTVSMKVTLPNFDQKSSAVVLIVTAVKANAPNESHLLYRITEGKSLPGNVPPAVVSSDLRWDKAKGSDKVTNGVREIAQQFLVNTNVYSKVRLSLDYWPDVSDEEARLTIKKLEND
jgi:hypothetical protein